MSADDRQLHNIYTSRLNNDLCTVAEKEEAKKQLEILEHKGAMGAALSAIEDFEQRLAAIELIKGRGKVAFTKPMFEELKRDIQNLHGAVDAMIDTHKVMVAATSANKGEITSLWADRRNDIEGAKIAAATLNRTERNMQELRERTDQKVMELQAADTKILKAMADIIADSIDEAKTVIAAEAQAAAIIAVSAIVGTPAENEPADRNDETEDPHDHLL